MLPSTGQKLNDDKFEMFIYFSQKEATTLQRYKVYVLYETKLKF